MAGFESLTVSHRAFLIDGQRTLQGNDVVIAGGQTTNHPSSGGKRIPEGAVVVKETGDGMYYLADAADGAAAGDINTAAVVTSDEKPDSDWASKTFTWVYRERGQTFSGTIVAAGGDDTIGEFVTLFNADAGFAQIAVASDAGASDLLVCTTRAKGDVTLTISENITLHTGFGNALGAAAGTSASGAQADYRVVTREVDLVDTAGVSRNTDPVATLKAGRFDESEMWGGSTATVPSEAKAVLISNGSTFE